MSENTVKELKIMIDNLTEKIKDGFESNDKNHQEMKDIFSKALDKKVSRQAFRPVQLITFGLAGGIMFWALNQMLGLITAVKAFF